MDGSTYAGGRGRGQSHLTARMRVFTAGMMSSKFRSQWEAFSSLLSSGRQSAVGVEWVGGRDRGLSPCAPQNACSPPT